MNHKEGNTFSWKLLPLSCVRVTFITDAVESENIFFFDKVAAEVSVLVVEIKPEMYRALMNLQKFIALATTTVANLESFSSEQEKPQK